MDARRRSPGMTLVELAVALALAALIAALAVPSFRGLYARAAVTAAANELVGAAHHARSHAILRAVPTVLCLSSDGESCQEGSATGARGWIVFENAHLESPPARGSDEPRIRAGRLAEPLRLSATRAAVTWWPVSRSGATSTLEICHAGAAVAARAVVVSRTGRPRMRVESGDGAAGCPS